MTPSALYEKSKCLGFRVRTVTTLKLEGIDGRAPPGVEPAASLDSARENSPGLNTARIDRSTFRGWWCQAAPRWRSMLCHDLRFRVFRDGDREVKR